nr:MAG TPA: Metal binding domain of Ada [Caudoviricetes sp.]
MDKKVANQFILKSCIPISKADAIANGYTACSRCGG